MDNAKFEQAYSESRNGADEFYRHPFVRSFQYSNGIRECADAGVHWLIDVLATEAPAQLIKAGESLATVTITVKNERAELTLSGSGDVEFWKKKFTYTDMPEGVWVFLLADEGVRRALILVSEY